LVNFGTAIRPITISSTRVGIAAWLMNARRYRFRLSTGKGDLPVTISHGRLADEGIMLVSVCHDIGFTSTNNSTMVLRRIGVSVKAHSIHKSDTVVNSAIPGKFRIIKRKEVLVYL
jgi:hypothetical protein